VQRRLHVPDTSGRQWVEPDADGIADFSFTDKDFNVAR
jgi:hypothetical protein